MWAQRTLSATRGPGAGIGEQLSFGGRGTIGFALAAAGDPSIWNGMTTDQQAWVYATLATLNANIIKATGTMCPGWVPPTGASGITSAAGCFQAWFNAQYAGAPVKQLRTDGVFDQDTLLGLQTITGLHPSDFPTPYPASATAAKGLSKGAMVGIAAGGATVLGGIIYAATRKSAGRKSKSKSKSKRR